MARTRKKDKKRNKSKRKSRGGWSPDPKGMRNRAEQQGRDFDNYIDRQFKMFKPHDGENSIRILPPPEDYEHWGKDIWVNYGIGADKQTYLSLSKMKGEADPIDEERRQAQKEGDEEYAKELTPKRRVLVWLIDRTKGGEDEGPQLWAMPWTLDKDIAKRCQDTRSGEVINPTDPEEGYDIDFTMEGKKPYVEYDVTDIGGFKRKPSPISDDEDEFNDWLDFVEDHPLDDVLVYYDYDHIKQVFEGAPSRASDDDDDDGRSGRKRRNRKRKRDHDEEPDDDDEDEEDEDEDEPPTRTRRKRKRDRDEDDEEDDIEDEDEELDEDADEDADDDDEDDNRKRRKRRNKRSRDDDEEDDDEEEEPKRKRRKSGKAELRDKMKRRKRDEEEDDEEEEDEDDEPKRRKRRRRR